MKSVLEHLTCGCLPCLCSSQEITTQPPSRKIDKIKMMINIAFLIIRSPIVIKSLRPSLANRIWTVYSLFFQQCLHDKCVIISILLSHLCESIPVDGLASRPNRLCNHFRMYRKAFISKPPAFLSSSLFRLHHAETSWPESSQYNKGNNSAVGNTKNTCMMGFY